MRKIGLILLILFLSMGLVRAAVDTKDGVAVTTDTTFDGQTGIDTIDGQTVTAGDACSETAFDYQQAGTSSEDGPDRSVAVGRIIGMKNYNPPSNQSVCRLDMELSLIVGNAETVGTHHFRPVIALMIVPEQNNGDLNWTEEGTTYWYGDYVTNITTTGVKTFTFSTPVAMNNGTLYGFGITSDEADNSNYTRWLVVPDANDDWKYSKPADCQYIYWSTTGEYVGSTDGYNWKFWLFGVE